MREIILDTETTGFDPFSGDRVVEIGCLELENLVPTGRTYHQYINPQRDMPEAAFRVHGLSTEFLAEHPLFEDVAEAFLDFVGDGQLVAHNAEFDMKFINWELETAGHDGLARLVVVDTLAIARQKFPGAQNSLDALCRRFDIDNSHRTLHGALMDAEILAEVYLELMGGRQAGLGLESASAAARLRDGASRKERPRRSFPPPSTDIAAHQAFVEGLPDALWRK